MGEMCDFEAEFYPENWHQKAKRKSKTKKLAVEVPHEVAPPTKANLDRLCRVLASWKKEEAKLWDSYGPPNDYDPRSLRVQRINDALALDQVLCYVLNRGNRSRQ
jgi:hypothetical protein